METIMLLYPTYLTTLAASGFISAESRQHRFYRKTSDRTALIVNLTNIGDETDEAVYIVYGITTIGASPDFEQSFHVWGASDEEIKLRHSTVATLDNEVEVAKVIRARFEEYAVLDSDAVKAVAKEKQKAFLNRIHAVLKPRGYRRKGNTWTKTLPTGWTLTFNAQKSAYSDEFYFNYAAYREGENRYLPSIHGRLSWTDAEGKERYIFDWQLLSDEAADALIVHPTIRLLTYLEQTHGANPSP